MTVKKYEVITNDGTERHCNFTLWENSRKVAIQEAITILKCCYRELAFEVEKGVSPTKIVGRYLSGETKPYILHDVVAILTFGGERG